MARARSFGNIRKLPSGRSQARYWRRGKQVAADTTFASKTDARRWPATVEADMVRSVWIDPNAGRIPFGKYATRWVAEPPVRPRTREIYEGQLRHIVTVFADVDLCDVHPVAVRTWHGRLAASGLHHNTVAKIYRLFRSIMTTAVDEGLIARNPVRIKGASAERMIERPLLRWDDVRPLAGASATSPAPKQRPREPRSERSCRSWATPRAPPASATSRPPNTEAAKSPTPSTEAWRADSLLRLATCVFETPLELLLVATPNQFPVQLPQTLGPLRIDVSLPLSESLDQPDDAGRVVRTHPGECVFVLAAEDPPAEHEVVVASIEVDQLAAQRSDSRLPFRVASDRLLNDSGRWRLNHRGDRRDNRLGGLATGTICVLLGVDDVVERRNRNADVAGRKISRAVPPIGIAHVDSVEVWDPGRQVDGSRSSARQHNRCRGSRVQRPSAAPLPRPQQRTQRRDPRAPGRLSPRRALHIRRHSRGQQAFISQLGHERREVDRGPDLLTVYRAGHIIGGRTSLPLEAVDHLLHRVRQTDGTS